MSRGIMDEEHGDIAARYRDHAEELRTASTEALDTRTRKALVELAEEYDRLARTQDIIARSTETLRRLNLG